MVTGQWMRFRMAFAGHGDNHAISLDDPNGNCEMGVLAKDGVYLGEVPRMEPKLFFTAASRCETPALSQPLFESVRDCMCRSLFDARWLPRSNSFN